MRAELLDKVTRAEGPARDRLIEQATALDHLLDPNLGRRALLRAGLRPEALDNSPNPVGSSYMAHDSDSGLSLGLPLED